MQYRIEWAQGVDALEQWAGQWHTLALDTPPHLPMLTPAWVAAYASTMLPPGAEWQCVLAHQDGRLVAVLPLVVSGVGAGRPGMLGIRSASTPYDTHSAFGDALADPACGPSLMADLLEAIKERRA